MRKAVKSADFLLSDYLLSSGLFWRRLSDGNKMPNIINVEGEAKGTGFLALDGENVHIYVIRMKGSLVLSPFFNHMTCDIRNPAPSLLFTAHQHNRQHSRVRAALLVVGHSQVVALHHKDVELSQLLDVVHSKLDAPLDFNVAEVTVVNAADAATDLLEYKRTQRKM